MKKILSLIATCLFFVGNVSAQSELTLFEKVFDVISSEKIFDSSFYAVLQELNGLCKESTLSDNDPKKYGNVECIKEVGVETFDMIGRKAPTLTLIQSSFYGTDKCAYMKKVLTKLYGKPKKVTSECEINWVIKSKKKNVPQKYVGFQAVKEKNIINFTIGEEQGP